MESTPVRNLVLCVDDEEVIRFLLESALGRFGYVALVASDGREALRLAAQHRVDAVILDYQSDHKYVDMKVGSEGCVLSMRREKEHANGPG